jgi:ABC-type transporter Mla MlaB component
MLRIEKVTGGRSTLLKLSGRIEEEHLAQLQSEIEKSGARGLDLKDVNLVDRSSVLFLLRCESHGIRLVNCPLYVQEWISTERRRPSREETLE